MQVHLRLILISCLLLTHSLAYAQLPNKILVYVGPGAGAISIKNTLSTLAQVLPNGYKIATVNAATIQQTGWMQDTAMLIMPGGADLPYLASLKGQGNRNIVEYVSKGGKYLGICAGAYYGAARIEFAKGDPRLEVLGERELKFYPGLVKGPTYEGYDPNSSTPYIGAQVAKIIWESDSPFKRNQNLNIFYYGGGSFVAAEKYSNTKVLARYSIPSLKTSLSPAAIIECSVGQGKVILSGVHFEWQYQSLPLSTPELIALRKTLNANERNRLTLAKYLIEQLLTP